MRLEDERESSNIEDRRGSQIRLGRKKSLGLLGIILVLVAAYFGADPGIVLNLLQRAAPVVEERGTPPVSGQAPVRDETTVFISKVLANTEDIWRTVFADMGQRYREPTLVLFSGVTPSACGMGQAAMGPFYCPLDQKLYVDLRFFDQLKNRYGAPGDFARAYVLAHEVGHHVQNLLGIAGKVQSLQQRVRPEEANQLSVGLELQADCLAGVWANRAHHLRNILEPGDLEAGLRAAAAVGDDTLQRRTQGYVVPETFTHGTSQQRASWFRQGLKSGDVRSCDTFGG